MRLQTMKLLSGVRVLTLAWAVLPQCSPRIFGVSTNMKFTDPFYGNADIKTNVTAQRFRAAVDLLCLSEAWKRPLPVDAGQHAEDTEVVNHCIRSRDITVLELLAKIVTIFSRNTPDVVPWKRQLVTCSTVTRSRADRQRGGWHRLRFSVPFYMRHLSLLVRSYMDCLLDGCEGILKDLDEDCFLTAFSRVGTLPDFVDGAKFVCALPLAYCFSQSRKNPGFEHDLPEKKGNLFPYLFSGVLARRLKSFFRKSSSQKVTKVGLAILFAKRGCATVPESFVEKAIEKHKKAMAAPFLANVPPEIYARMNEIADEVWLNLLPDPEECVKQIRTLYPPKNRASFEKGRGQGGHVSEFAEMLDFPKRNLWGVGLPSDIVEADYYNEPVLLYDVNGGLRVASGLLVSYEDLVAKYQRLSDADVRPGALLPVRVSPVLEPLKVRIITAGSSVPYTLSTGLQRLMHGALRVCPIFQLIGKPISSEVVRSLCSSFGHLWVSGDYSAATDGLNINASRVIFESLLRKLKITDFEKDMFRHVLYEQAVFYPDKTVVTQKNGQLMGSPLSFPILCVANLTCFWMAAEAHYGRRFSFEEMSDKVLVNGDDIGFSTNSSMYATWSRYLTYFGFTKSVGKNYVSERYLIINSTCWDMRSENRDQVKHLNCGSLTGISRTSGREETRYTALCNYYNDLISGASETQVVSRTLKFFHYNKDEIAKITRKGLCNLFLPVILGGAGFHLAPAYERFVQAQGKQVFTKLQKVMASRLAEEAFEEHEPSLPFPGERPYDNSSALWGHTRDITPEGEVTQLSRVAAVNFEYPREVTFLPVISSIYVDQKIFEAFPDSYEHQPADTSRPFGLDLTIQEHRPIRCEWPSWARKRINKDNNWVIDPIRLNVEYVRVDTRAGDPAGITVFRPLDIPTSVFHEAGTPSFKWESVTGYPIDEMWASPNQEVPF